MRDDEVMLIALSKERERLHDELMQVDRIMRKIKDGIYLADQQITAVIVRDEPKQLEDGNTFPTNANIKIQLLKVFDLLCCAVKLKEVQDEYTRQTGKAFNVREGVRSLHAAKLLYSVKEKDANRSIFWVKRDWVEDGVLLSKHKPEGFDMLYKDDNLEYI